MPLFKSLSLFHVTFYDVCFYFITLLYFILHQPLTFQPVVHSLPVKLANLTAATKFSQFAPVR